MRPSAKCRLSSSSTEAHLVDLDEGIPSRNRERFDQSASEYVLLRSQFKCVFARQDGQASAPASPPHGGVFFGPHEADHVEEPAVVVRSLLRGLIGSALSLDVGSGLGQQSRVGHECGNLSEIEDGPVFRAVVGAVWKHVFRQQADLRSRQLLFRLVQKFEVWTYCSSVPVGAGYWCLSVLPWSMSNSARRTYSTRGCVRTRRLGIVSSLYTYLACSEGLEFGSESRWGQAEGRELSTAAGTWAVSVKRDQSFASNSRELLRGPWDGVESGEPIDLTVARLISAEFVNPLASRWSTMMDSALLAPNRSPWWSMATSRPPPAPSKARQLPPTRAPTAAATRRTRAAAAAAADDNVDALANDLTKLAVRSTARAKPSERPKSVVARPRVTPSTRPLGHSTAQNRIASTASQAPSTTATRRVASGNVKSTSAELVPAPPSPTERAQAAMKAVNAALATLTTLNKSGYRALATPPTTASRLNSTATRPDSAASSARSSSHARGAASDITTASSSRPTATATAAQAANRDKVERAAKEAFRALFELRSLVQEGTLARKRVDVEKAAVGIIANLVEMEVVSDESLLGGVLLSS